MLLYIDIIAGWCKEIFTCSSFRKPRIRGVFSQGRSPCEILTLTTDWVGKFSLLLSIVASPLGPRVELKCQKCLIRLSYRRASLSQHLPHGRTSIWSSYVTTNHRTSYAPYDAESRSRSRPLAGIFYLSFGTRFSYYFYFGSGFSLSAVRWTFPAIRWHNARLQLSTDDFRLAGSRPKKKKAQLD